MDQQVAEVVVDEQPHDQIVELSLDQLSNVGGGTMGVIVL